MRSASGHGSMPGAGTAEDGGAVPGGPAAAPAAAHGRFSEPATWAALEPVRTALLRDAHAAAAGVLEQAHQRAADAIAQAQRAAGEQVDAARQAGRAQAAPLAAARRSRGRRDATAAVLRARREVVAQLRGQVGERVLRLHDEPGYAELRERLVTVARRLAGPAAVLTEDPAGGILARGEGVVVDCSLPRLAEAALAALGPRVDDLWRAGARRGSSRPGGQGPSARPDPGAGSP